MLTNTAVRVIACGHCKSTHPTVAAVRACSASDWRARGRTPNRVPDAHAVAAALAPMSAGRTWFTEVTLPRERAAASSSVKVEPVAYVPRPAMPGSRQPAASSSVTDEVLAGRYALVADGIWKFYKIDRPTDGKWKGYTFVAVLASDEEYAIRNRPVREAILDAIRARGVREAMADYGRQIGSCGMCHRTLTDPESIAAGIGPICAAKF